MYNGLVSVVIPVYNVKNYLNECIESVICQTYKNIEIICVDDCSNDGSIDILNKFASQEARLLVVKNEVNKGLAISRNVGMSHAKGEFLFFLDSDDYIKKDIIEKLVEKINYDKSDIVTSKAVAFPEDESVEGIAIDKNKWLNRFFAESLIVSKENFSELMRKMISVSWGNLYRVAFIKKYNLSFGNMRVLHEDNGFLMKVLSCCPKISMIKDIGVMYRIRTNSIMGELVDDDIRHRKNLKLTFLDALEYIRKNHGEDYEYYEYELKNNIPAYSGIFNDYYGFFWENVKYHRDDIIHYNISDPFISIIIPVFNAGKYIEDTLLSALGQSLKNIEIICIDDGSTDNSVPTIKKFMAKDNRVRFASQDHLGSGPARNVGMDLAKGKFIAFLDSDDFYPSEFTLERMYKCACDNNALIVGGSLNQWRVDHLVTDSSMFEEGYTFKQDGFISFQDYQFDYGYWRFIYDHKFLKENKLSFPDYLRGQDPPFFVSAMLAAKKFYALREATYVYRCGHHRPTLSLRIVSDKYKSDVQLIKLAIANNLQNLKYRVLERLNTYYFLKDIDMSNFEMCKAIYNEISKDECNVIEMIKKQFKLNKFYTYLEKLPSNSIAISVVIPVYNTEKYLTACLDSVVNQTLKNIEIICVNDGSTDGSLAILERYAQKDDRIIVINQKNMKQGAARNNGLAKARGQYIKFVDSDDILPLEALEKIYQKCLLLDVDMYLHAGENFNNETGKHEYNAYYNFTYLPHDWSDDIFDYRKCYNFLPKMAVSAALCIYKSDFLKKNNIYFCEKLFYEDNPFFIESIFLAKKVFIDKEILYFRRLHSASTTQNWDKNFCDYIKIVDIIMKKLKKLKVKEDLIAKYKEEYFKSCVFWYNKFNESYRKKYASEMVSLFGRYNVPLTNLKLPSAYPKSPRLLFGFEQFFDESSFYLLGLRLYKKQKSLHKKRISVLGIQLYKRDCSDCKKRISILGIPVYSVKKKDYEVTRRILFFKYKKRNRIQAIQDKLWYNQQQLEKVRRELADSRREIANLRNEIKAVASKPRRFILTEVEDK